MSHYPSYGPPPPPYPGYHPPPPPPGPPGGYAYMPVPVMLPYPQPQAPEATYVTNYYVQQPGPAPQPAPAHPAYPPPYAHPAHAITEAVKVVEDVIDWVPATGHTAASFESRAVVAGHEGWDGSPLWVIRAHHSGDLVPGKLAVKHRSAYIPHSGREVPVHNFEILMTPAHLVRWVPASNGQVPAGAIAAGNTVAAEPLYIGRVRQSFSLTPGKVHPSHRCCYISYAGREIVHKTYEVLCKV